MSGYIGLRHLIVVPAQRMHLFLGLDVDHHRDVQGKII